MKIRALHILILISLTFSITNAQWLSPPYKAEISKAPFPGYFSEADLDGDGTLENITLFQRKDLKFKPMIVFYTKDKKLIDAYNGKTDYDYFGRDFILHSEKEKKDYFLITRYTKYAIVFEAISIKNGLIDVRQIYKFKVGCEAPSGDTRYLLLKKKKRLVVFFATDFPKRRCMRRIISIDTETFDVLWEKLVPDFVLSLFYSTSQKNSFYFTTVAFTNNLFRSNNTFYDSLNNKIIIDTSFIKNPPLRPQIDAPDYATDSCSYIVKVSLDDGKELKRIKTGGQFYRTRPQYKIVDTIQRLIIFDRRNSLSSLAYYDTEKDSFYFPRYFRNVKSPYDITTPGLYFKKDFLLKYSPDSFEIYKFANNSPVLYKKINEPYFFVPTGNDSLLKNFLIAGHTTLPYIGIFSNDFSLLARIHFNENMNFTRFFWSKNFKRLIFVTPGNPLALQIKLVKLPFYKRFTPEFTTALMWGGIILSLFLLLLWALTLRITTRQLKIKTRQLEIKNKEIELATAKLIHSEKLALLGTISASIAHQLNSPLGAILNSAERILRKEKEPNAELIKRSAEYSKQLVQKFLETSRGAPANESNCSDFNTTLNDWLMLFKDEISKRQIEIRTELSNEKKKLPLKKSELLEIISNLMFNARDAILASQKSEKIITVKTRYENNNFVLEVTDTGTGFDEKILSVIFEPFQTTKDLGKGTGLGLWIVKKLVDNYNGNIKLENTENGAKVTIEFPAVENCA